MYPFWAKFIEPLIFAADAGRIVEIGALRGETTALMLESLGPDAELHVIDPVPAFDPAEHERRFPGRYVFHRDLSLNVLPDAKAFDVALVDGDHNWYTVYNELRLLREASRREDRALPMLVLHDVLWPYGRRDLYYEPSQIPEEFRQPFARRGMMPGHSELMKRGGMNYTLHNALEEGGPRNGVMTGLDDFLAEHDQPYRLVLLPIYFGLAIVVEERMLDAHPALRAKLDEIESEAGKQELLELSEKIRIDATVFEHNFLRVRDEQLAEVRDRYLALLRAALLDEHYLENELRIAHLLERMQSNQPVHSEHLRAPESHLRKDFVALRNARRNGQDPDGDDVTAHFPFTAMGGIALDHLHECLTTVREEGVAGDLVECGAGKGGGAVYLRGYLEAHAMPQGTVWVADRFRSSPDDRPRRALAEGGIEDLQADLNQVRDAFDRFDLLDDRVRFLQGPYRDTLSDAGIGPIALLRLGRGLGADARDVLDALYDRVADGGFVVVEDGAADDGTAAVIEEFRAARGLTAPSTRVGWGGTAWRKGAEAPVATAPEADGVKHRAPLASPAPRNAVDLTVVVVFYDMKREAARTLYSLSRAYQEGIEDLDYEVLVVENGSHADERLGREFVESFGPEFRYLDLGDAATPSPTDALNRGMAAARGRNFAFMIDGAHLLTPGVLRFGMAGLRTYDQAVVATQQWYVGPGQQPIVVDQGYDQTAEDALFGRIAWPEDGYRLFEISHFIGDRDWFDGILESNCLFVGRKLLEQVGGFDDSFDMAGGGYANLELWERLAAAPDATMVSILGEGSFHQLHGGTTTNDPEHVDRRTKIFSYGEHYRDLRGRPMRGPAKVMHYVGSLPVDAARRTRARRMTASMFAGIRSPEGPDGIPTVAEQMPEELRTTLIEAFWRGLSWQDTTWLGNPVDAAPTDLLVYQELVASVRPDWIVETGTGSGGRAFFLATVCELLGHGHVISIGDEPGERPSHPRITYVPEPPHTERARARVVELTGASPHAMLILGSRVGTQRLLMEFEQYAPLVPEGSYVVFENTIVNGRPVWPGYGAGPIEAVQRTLVENGDFVQDTSWEKHGLTFHPGGFLRRIRPSEGGR